MEALDGASANSIPPEFEDITVAEAAFYKLVETLDCKGNGEFLKRHVLISTSLGHLVELEADKVLRSLKLNWKDVTKIVVHHEFHPLRIFIILMHSSHKAAILRYDDLKILHEWEDISDVSSSDPDNSGSPQLFLSLLSGETLTISSKKLISLSLETSDHMTECTERGKKEAALALAHRLKSGIRHVERVSSERKMKEIFIAQKLRSMESYLQGLDHIEKNNLVTALTLGEDNKITNGKLRLPTSASSTAPLRIFNIRQKIIHNKWVIGLSVVNEADRVLVCNPELLLHISSGTKSVSYTTLILRTVQRKVAKSDLVSGDASHMESRTSIEKLEPPILRPKKRACILGVCEMPKFSEGPKVTCSGLITFSCKSLATETTQHLINTETFSHQYQVAFEPLELVANELNDHIVLIENNAVAGGISFSNVAVVAASVCNSVSLSTLSSPLTHFMSKLSKNYEIVKMFGLSDMYCFFPHQFHPLKHAAFRLQHIDSHAIELTLYTKDDEQAMLVVHSILAVLPPDAMVKPTACREEASYVEIEKKRHELLAKMKEATAFVQEGYETQAKSSRRQDKVGDKYKEWKAKEADSGQYITSEVKTLREEYMNDVRAFESRKDNITFDSKLYNLWRKKLYEIQNEMDIHYLEYLH